MADLSATELAARLDLSKARISQYVSSGALNGCFVGEGRARRFNLAKVADALGRKLDFGQMMGNGAETRRALKEIAQGSDGPPPKAELAPQPRRDAPLPPQDPDRYELARIQNAEEDARRKRRNNQSEEGIWVLATEVERQSAKLIGQEIAQFESALRDGARAVADHFGVDFREVRQLLLGQWRTHRGDRVDALSSDIAAAKMSEAEQEADV